jgi:hypothetical protein
VQERSNEAFADADGALEAQMAALDREVLEKRDQRCFVRRRGRPETEGRAVAQNDVFALLESDHAAIVAVRV